MAIFIGFLVLKTQHIVGKTFRRPTSSANQLLVNDALTGQEIATVAVGGRPSDIGVNPKTNRIYVTRDDGVMQVIDGVTNTVTATVGLRIGFNISVNPETNRIYVTGASFTASGVEVVDGETNTLLTTIALPLGYNLTRVPVNTRTDRLYVPASDQKTMTVIDGASNSIIGAVPVGNCEGGIAVNPATGQLYVADTVNDAITVLAEKL